MNIRYWLVAGCVLALLIGLVFSTSALPTLAKDPVSVRYRLDASMQLAPYPAKQGSGNYRLVVSQVGNVPSALASDSYAVNKGIAVQAEVAQPMESENYQVSGIVPYKIYLPLVLKTS